MEMENRNKIMLEVDGKSYDFLIYRFNNLIFTEPVVNIS